MEIYLLTSAHEDSDCALEDLLQPSVSAHVTEEDARRVALEDARCAAAELHEGSGGFLEIAAIVWTQPFAGADLSGYCPETHDYYRISRRPLFGAVSAEALTGSLQALGAARDLLRDSRIDESYEGETL